MTALRMATVVLVIACAAQAGEVRAWTGTNGKTLQAELVRESGGQVTLRTRDGRVIQTRRSSLSRSDGDYLDSLKAPAPAPRVVAPAPPPERDDYRERRAAEQRAEAFTTRSIADTTVPRSAATAERTAPSAPETPNARASAPATTTSAPTKATPSEPQTGIWTIVAVVIGVIVFFKVVSKSRRQARKRRMIAEASAYFSTVKSEKRLRPIMTSLMLKKGEQAYLQSACSLNETRAVRHYERGGMGFRVAKGVYVGGSKGTSHSVPQMTRIDSGKLILTNTRLVFDGSQEDRNVPLNKIASLNQFIDALEVSSETRQKSMFFTVPNPLLWTAAIRILAAVDDPNDISGDTIDIQFT